MSLYCQQLRINASGSVRASIIGGSSQERDEHGNMMEVGLRIPPRPGVVLISQVDANPDILQCRADVQGYFSRPLEGLRVPGRVIVELPCDVKVTGPSGTSFLLECWPLLATGADRGGAQTAVRFGATVAPVPIWAQSFDLGVVAATDAVIFRDAAGVIVGTSLGAATNRTIPDEAATAELSGTDNMYIAFRQNG